MRRIIVSFIILLAPVVVCADVSTFVFTSTSALQLNERQTITVQSQNSSGLKENVLSTTCLEIRTTSSSGKLFASANGTDPVSVLILTMNKNSANRNFYYEDSQVGSYTFSLKAVYRPEEEKRTCPNWPVHEWGNVWTSSQNYTIGSGSQNTGGTGESSSGGVTTDSSSSGQVDEGSLSDVQSGGSYEPLVPQVTAEMNVPKTVIAGAQFFVSGEGYGLEKKPLENARYVWNFGDGTTKEGKSVAHTYRNIGEYALVLDVSSDKFTGSTRQSVSVVKSPLLISKVSLGIDGFIEIKNEAGGEFDLSGWIIDVSGNKFVLPRNTYILSRGILMLDATTLGFAITNPVSLLYSNGSLASSFSSPIQTSKSETQFTPQAPVKKEISTENPTLLKQEKVPVEQLSAGVVFAAEATTSEGEIYEGIQEENTLNDTPSNYWWFVAFIALIVITSSSVFLIQKPKSSLADEFTIEE